MKLWTTEVNVRLEWWGWPTNRTPKVFMEIPSSNVIRYTVTEEGCKAIEKLVRSFGWGIQVQNFLMEIIVFKNEHTDQYDIRFDGESINEWFTDESLASIFKSTDRYGVVEDTE